MVLPKEYSNIQAINAATVRRKLAKQMLPLVDRIEATLDGDSTLSDKF